MTTYQLISQHHSIHPGTNGIAIDSEDAMGFSVLQDVKTVIERFPLKKVAEAYEHMMSGPARVRAVPEIGDGRVS